MYARLISGRIRNGQWDEYHNFYVNNVVPSTSGTKGLRVRYLLRGIADPQEGISISIWDTWEDVQAYEKSKVRLSNVKRSRKMYAGEYSMELLEVAYSEENN